MLGASEAQRQGGTRESNTNSSHDLPRPTVFRRDGSPNGEESANIRRMPILLELTDRAGFHELEVVAETFWIGGQRSGCEVTLDLAEVHGRVLEVAVDSQGRLRVRKEPGLPFPVRCATGSVGSRFEHFLDGDVLNVGPALVKLRYQAETGEGVGQELDPATLPIAPGSPVGTWYETFMEMADHLEGLTAAERMVAAAMASIVRATGADRVHVMIDTDDEDGGDAFYLTRPDDESSFRKKSKKKNTISGVYGGGI